MAAAPEHNSESQVTVKPGPKLKTALLVAIVADIVQLVIFPLVITGAESPADDILDLCAAGLLGALLGWHWEFLPSFLAKLIPGVDMIPLWTLAVVNVYRKAKPQAVAQAKAGAPS